MTNFCSAFQPLSALLQLHFTFSWHSYFLLAA